MTQMQHVYVTGHGSFASGPWVGEAAQFGLRLTIEETASRPTRGTIYTPGVCGDAVLDQGTASGTHGTLTKTFTARMGPIGSPQNFDGGAQVDCAEDLWTFMNAVKAYQAPAFKWTHVKLCPIAADGHAIGHSAVYQFTTPLAGTGSTGVPPQVAAAVSLYAPLIGRRGRGRIYVPMNGGALFDTDGLMGSTARTTLSGALVTLVGNLENLPGSPLYQPQVAIMSAGVATAVCPVSVRIGNRYDTMRSRRQQSPETYTATNL